MILLQILAGVKQGRNMVTDAQGGTGTGERANHGPDNTLHDAFPRDSWFYTTRQRCGNSDRNMLDSFLFSIMLEEAFLVSAVSFLLIKLI